MHTLTKALLTVAAAGILSFGAFAEGGRGQHGRGLERMQQTLNLSEAQMAQLRPIFEAQKAQRQQAREQMKARFESILTAEQKAQLQTYKAERQARSKEGNQGFRRGEGGPLARLNLSADQKAQFKALRESLKPQRQAERQRFQQQLAQILTPEQKARLEALKSEHQGRRRGQQ